MAPRGTRSQAEQALVDQIIAVLGEAFSEIKCVGSERMMRAGLSMGHWHLLILLARHGEMSMSRLADFHGVSMSNATGLIDRLEERGLVERIRVADDRRVVLVRVTEAGRQQLEEVDLLREELIGRVIDQLDSGQLERLNLALADVRDALGRVLGDDADPSLREHLASHAHGLAHDHSPTPAQTPA